MSQEVLNVRISDEQRSELEKIAETKGLTLSEVMRAVLDEELQKSQPEPSHGEQLAALQQEQQKIAERIAKIKRAEEERRIAEQERQRQEALKQTEAQIRATLPDLLDLRYRALTELINNAIETASGFARKYEKLIKTVEAGARETEPLKKEYLRLGGNFDALYSELEGDIEKVELVESAKKLLEIVRRQRAVWFRYDTSPLMFLDTRLISDGADKSIFIGF